MAKDFELKIEIEGLEELQKKLAAPYLIGPPLHDFLHGAGQAVERRAKQLSPVDTGRLRASITTVVHGATIPLWAKVGTIVEYAPYIEFGTSKMAAQPFLRPGLAAARGRIGQLLDRMRVAIEERFGKK